MRRSISTLLAGLLAWFSVGAVERSATAALDDASWSADAGHAALVQGSRPAQDLARPRANRGLDAVLGRCLVFAPPTLRPPSSHILLRAAAPVVGIDRSCRSRRSSRGPPA